MHTYAFLMAAGLSQHLHYPQPPPQSYQQKGAEHHVMPRPGWI